MENVDNTAAPLEMAAVKAGNHTHTADDINWYVSQINCLYQWQFMNYFQMILNRLHGIVPNHIALQVEPHWLSPVEIRSSTCSINKDGGKLL